MSKPVYLLSRCKGFTEAYYQLSQEEKDSFMTKAGEIVKQSGEKQIIVCDSRWADEGLYFWGVFEYPDMESYQKKVEEFEKIGFWRYITAETILGTKME
jgi:hypothetical protein